MGTDGSEEEECLWRIVIKLLSYVLYLGMYVKAIPATAGNYSTLRSQKNNKKLTGNDFFYYYFFDRYYMPSRQL